MLNLLLSTRMTFVVNKLLYDCKKEGGSFKVRPISKIKHKDTKKRTAIPADIIIALINTP
jgi:hypothetical protein